MDHQTKRDPADDRGWGQLSQILAEFDRDGVNAEPVTFGTRAAFPLE